jgi:phosphohistidine phosphatase SixA
VPNWAHRLANVVAPFLLVLAGEAQAQAQQPDATAWAGLRDGAIVLFRHARAPGNGDPPGYRIGDCKTQRNLDASGREQARRIGEAFRAAQIRPGRVLASQWCRTVETAELAFPGQAVPDSAFNSFYDRPELGALQTAQAKSVLRAWRGPGALIVVTHQVNITALTGVTPADGEGVVVKLAGERIEVLGRIKP